MIPAKEKAVLCAIALVFLCASALRAQPSGVPGRAAGAPGPPAESLPPALRGIGIEQRLNAQLPLDLEFRDEDGTPSPLGRWFGQRPVVLALVYYECPMLCTQVLNGLVSGLRPLSLDAGRDFEVLAVSFDPDEGPELARAKKTAYVARYGRAGSEAGFHFLTGEQPSISALTDAAGFRYRFDPGLGEFVHASAIMVVTPDGRIARYFYGIEYPPRDLKFGLIEASSGRIGTVADRLSLYCYRYDPASGAYGLLTMRLLRVGGLLTVGAVAGFMFLSWRRDRRVQAGRDKTPGGQL